MNNTNIPFNKPHIIGKELDYISRAVLSEKISGDGVFSDKCNLFMKNRYNLKKVLLTNSCSTALDMSSLLIDIKPGDEVILPSYTPQSQTKFQSCRSRKFHSLSQKNITSSSSLPS